MHVEAQEHNDHIVFLHTVAEGSANRSFGLQVAKLAGVPNNVIERAKRKLTELEQQPNSPQMEIPLSETTTPEPTVDPLREALEALDLDQMTPMQALMWLNEQRKKH